MSENEQLSFSSRKALCVQLGHAAGTEIAQLLKCLVQRIQYLERNKVEVTPIIPDLPPDAANPISRRAA